MNTSYASYDANGRETIRRDRITGKTKQWRDALATAQPDQFAAELVEHAQNWLHAAQSKLGPCRKTSGPTRQQAAEFLSLAHWPTLHAILCGLIASRVKVGGSYGWFIQYAVKELYDEEL